MEGLTIGQLARRAGVGVETVRFYERRRLLPPPRRTASGYRQYREEDISRLQLIARAKRLGFTLAEIAPMVRADDSRTAGAVLGLAEAKVRELDLRLHELLETRSRVQRLVSLCQDAEHDCTALRVSL